jgi:hypothetical protein
MPEPTTVNIVEQVTPLGNWNILNIIERALSTAVQAFFASLPATIPLTVDQAEAVGISAAIAAGSAALSAVKNLIAEGVVVQAAKRAAA